jgi:hypothetical protein
MKRLVKGGIRRAMRRTDQHKSVLQKARVELPPLKLKDGSTGKKKQVRFKCAICGELFPQKNVAVDHIIPCIPIDSSEEEMSYDEIVKGIVCDASNLQVLCSTKLSENNNIPSCHTLKSNTERFMRKRIKEMKINNTFTELSPLLIATLEVEYTIYLNDMIEKAKNKKARRGKAQNIR